jgi:hypothetical protein
MKALKLIFLADRYHLCRYGRLITNDSYVAMKHGPVPSATRDIVESNDYLDEYRRWGFIGEERWMIRAMYAVPALSCRAMARW